MMSDALFGLLGLCKKAGKLVMGYDAVLAEVLVGGAHLVLVARDLSLKTRTRLESQLAGSAVTMVFCEKAMDEVEFYLGKKSGILAVCDQGFAKKICQTVEDTRFSGCGKS